MPPEIFSPIKRNSWPNNPRTTRTRLPSRQNNKRSLFFVRCSCLPIGSFIWIEYAAELCLHIQTPFSRDAVARADVARARLAAASGRPERGARETTAGKAAVRSLAEIAAAPRASAG